MGQREVLAMRVQAALWKHEYGDVSPDETVSDLESVRDSAPDWDWVHFALANVLDARFVQLTSAARDKDGRGRGKARGSVQRDPHEALLPVLESYGRAVQHSDSFLFKALPRLLTLWFQGEERDGQEGREHRDKCADLMKRLTKDVAAYKWYTVLPQVISRLDMNSAAARDFVERLIGRLFSYFPSQTMWAMAAVLNASNEQRKGRVAHPRPARALTVSLLRVGAPRRSLSAHSNCSSNTRSRRKRHRSPRSRRTSSRSSSWHAARRARPSS